MSFLPSKPHIIPRKYSSLLWWHAISFEPTIFTLFCDAVIFVSNQFQFIIFSRLVRIQCNVPIEGNHNSQQLWYNRDLKQGRRRRLRERNKFAYSVGKNNSFARPARAFHILIHFFAVLVLTTTWNDQIWGHVEDESTWRRVFNFLFNCPHRSHQFYSWIAHSHFPSRTTWSNRKIITVTGNNIFRQRSRSRRRRPCLRSLIRCNERFWNLGLVVQKPFHANPRLKINQGVYFSTPKYCSTLIFGKIVRWRQSILKNQNKKNETKVYANPGLCISAFKQPGPSCSKAD